jgi:hypothetical protein
MDTGGAAESIGEERFGDSEPPRWHDRRVEFNEVPRFAEDDSSSSWPASTESYSSSTSG